MGGELSIFRVAGPLVVRESGPTLGGVWLNVGDAPFPQERWNDFVHVVLASAVQALTHASVGRMAAIHFFDGPFEVRIAGVANGLLSFEARERRLVGTVVVRQAQVSIQIACASLLQAVEEALALGDAAGDGSTVGLRSSLPELRRLVETHSRSEKGDA